MSDLLQNLLTVPHAALVGDVDFKDPQGAPMVTFIIEDDGDLQTQLSTALSRLGVACILDVVDGRCEAPDAYPVHLSPISIVADISENVLMNRTEGKVAGVDYLTLRQTLGMVMDKLHLQYNLSVSNFRSVQPPKGADAGYQIYFEASETLENTRN